MSKLEIIVLSGVGYGIKSTDPSTEPRGTPYKSVPIGYYVFNDFRNETQEGYRPVIFQLI